MADDPKPDAPKPEDLGDAGKKALDAERKARRDAEQKAKDLEARLDALETTKKSEMEQLTATVKKLGEDLATERSDKLRLEVATVKGLTPAQAKRLTGASREELEADADDLLEAFPAPKSDAGDKKTDDPPAKSAPPSQKPKPELKGGSDPTGDPEPSVKDLVDAIPPL